MPSHTLTRTVTSTVAIAALIVSLAACAAPETAAPEPSTDPAGIDVCATPGGAEVESITVSGEWGSQPQVEFEAGLNATETQRVVQTAGDGKQVDDGDYVLVSYTIHGGNSGDLIEAVGYDDAGPGLFIASIDRLMPGLLKAMGCVPIGSRVVSVVSAADAFGDTGLDNDFITIAPGESLIVTMDLERHLDRAWGDDQPAIEGMPSVALDADGAPTVTIPEGATPAELQLAVLKQGDGVAIPEHADVVVQYHGVSWDTGEVFDSSWMRGEPGAFSLDSVVPGFAQAIAGQAMGSQVVVVIPAELAYGPKTGAGDHALAGQTLIFVIDVLYGVEHSH